MLKLSDRRFKITVTNILSILMEKVENVQDYMHNVSRDGNSRNQKKILDMKNRNEEYV